MMIVFLRMILSRYLHFLREDTFLPIVIANMRLQKYVSKRNESTLESLPLLVM